VTRFERSSRRLGGQGVAVTTMLVHAVVVVLFTAAAARAQRRERPRDVYVPQLGVSLAVGWKLVFHDGCQVAVPALWQIAADDAWASAPDGAITVAIRAVPVANWSMYKQQITMQVNSVDESATVHESGASRAWWEWRERTRVVRYLAVLTGSIACTGELDLRHPTESSQEELTTRIMESLGPSSASYRR
jgi:hypothetical protein